MPKKYFLMSGIILCIIILASLAFFRNQGIETETIVVKKGTITKTIEDTGIIQPALESKIFAEQNGTIKNISVEIGQKAAPGQTLFVMENTDLSLKISETRANLLALEASLAASEGAIKQAELELNDARINLERTAALFKEGAVSQTKLEEAESLVKKLENSLQKELAYRDNLFWQKNELYKIIKELEKKQDNLIIKSPIKGILMEINVKKGQPVNTGTLLAVVGDSENLEIKADILIDYMPQIKIGQEVIITSPALENARIKGQVKKIYPKAEEKKSALGVVEYRVPVLISLNEKSYLKPGYKVDIAIITEEHRHVLTIPREAVRILNNKPAVMKIVDGKIKYQPIVTGLVSDGDIEVKKGLHEKDVIVKNGSLDLKEGTRVK